MTKEIFKVNDIVTLTSKRWRYSDMDKNWIVIDISADYMEFVEDDRLKIKLNPPRGQVKLRIDVKYLPDFNIKKV